jgi:amidase
VAAAAAGNAALLSLGLARKAGDVPGLDDSAGDSIEQALGGDQGGSIRIPASFTGVYGLKPTMGLVPYTGIASLHPMIDHCGPMATNLMDIARLLSVIAGYDGLDPRMTPESPLREYVKDYAAELSTFTARKLPTGSKLGTGLRIGLPAESFTAVSDAVRTTVHAAATRHFAGANATVHENLYPPPPPQPGNLDRRNAQQHSLVRRARHPTTLALAPAPTLAAALAARPRNVRPAHLDQTSRDQPPLLVHLLQH